MTSQKPVSDNSWLRTFSIGFAIISFGITLAIAGYFLTNNKTQPVEKPVPARSSKTENSDMPPLLIKSIGVNLDYYNSKTGKAGDFLFTKQKLQFDRLFMGFGFVIPASSVGAAKSNPQPTFILPLHTPVRSLGDGIVANVATLYSGDVSVQVTLDGKIQKWIYETEHVINPKVKIGDKVSAGQILGEVSNYDKNVPPGFGIIEIGILEGGKIPSHVCPFAYLDPSIKEEMLAKIKAFYKAWETYRNDSALYNETTGIPGCLTLEELGG